MLSKIRFEFNHRINTKLFVNNNGTNFIWDF